MNVRVAISGKMGSGKTTLARALQHEFSDPVNWYESESYIPQIIGFGAPIRELLSRGNINKHDAQFREAAQNMGMAMREIDPKFWINVFYNTAPASVIIDDLRFKNEFEWCKRHGFYLIRLLAPYPIREARGADVSRDFHVSETELDEQEGWDFACLNTNYTDTTALAKILLPKIREHCFDSNVYRRGATKAVSSSAAAE